MNPRPTWYKAARWNGEADDVAPNIVAMKRGPNCAHGIGHELGLDPAFLFCRYRCGLVTAAPTAAAMTRPETRRPTRPANGGGL